jgi:hypothetical protein
MIVQYGVKLLDFVTLCSGSLHGNGRAPQDLPCQMDTW